MGAIQQSQALAICFKALLLLALFKGIVSLDWGGLKMILLDRLEVFNISASCFLKIFAAVFIQYF